MKKLTEEHGTYCEHRLRVDQHEDEDTPNEAPYEPCLRGMRGARSLSEVLVPGRRVMSFRVQEESEQSCIEITGTASFYMHTI